MLGEQIQSRLTRQPLGIDRVRGESLTTTVHATPQRTLRCALAGEVRGHLLAPPRPIRRHARIRHPTPGVHDLEQISPITDSLRLRLAERLVLRGLTQRLEIRIRVMDQTLTLGRLRARRRHMHAITARMPLEALIVPVKTARKNRTP